MMHLRRCPGLIQVHSEAAALSDVLLVDSTRIADDKFRFKP